MRENNNRERDRKAVALSIGNPIIVDTPATAGAAVGAFDCLLRDQVGKELHAAHQYLAIAVYLDALDFPQLASWHYRSAAVERSHAMMFIRFLLVSCAGNSLKI